MKTKRKHSYARKNFDEFVRGYIDAALWSSTDNADESGGEPLDKNYSRSNIAASSLKSIKRVCARFLKANSEDLYQYVNEVEYDSSQGSAWDYAGHDFWLTANGHGAGFWDRRGVDRELGRRLSDAAHEFASDMYVGDDDQIYVSPER